MQTFIKKHNNSMLVIILVLISIGTLFNSCKKDEDINSKIELYSYGPMPIARGAELRFIGNMLDKVSAIELPGGITIDAASFTSQNSKLITLTVPQNAVEGYIVIKTPQGDIQTKTPMGFSEPISISSFSPSPIKPGATLSISGDYLNLVKEVIFTDRIAVVSADFISQSREKITLAVPEEAQTGKIAVSNGAEDPIVVYSETSLTVVLPAITAIIPNPVVPNTAITITGTDLDLVNSIIFGGEKEATSFTSQSATEIVVTVPVDAEDAIVRLVVASQVEVESSDVLAMVKPTVSVSPTTIKNLATLNVTGTNLQLIVSATFADGATANVEAGGTGTAISFIVPETATSGEVVFNTTSGTAVSGGNITIIAPTITSFTPATGKAGVDIVITGANFDIVSKVVFTGEIEGVFSLTGTTTITVPIPVGAKTGKIKLVAINDVEVSTATDLTVTANLPNFTSYSEAKGTPGEILTINGTNMDLIKTLVFPGDIAATEYGIKSSTMVQVYVPKDVTTGMGQIKMITYEGEEGLLPEIFIGGTDPILPTTLLISNFDGGGASQSTWGSVVTFGTPTINLNGTAAMLGLTGDGWQWTWANNWDTRPALANPENYVLKFDICITQAASGVSAGMTLKGWDTAVDLGQPFNTSTNGSWITMTFDVLTAGMSIDGTGDWGIWINGSNYDLTGIMIDNLRFDLK